VAARKTTAQRAREHHKPPERHYPKPPTHMPPEPKWMALLGNRRTAQDARAWWASVVPTLHASGILTRLDQTLVVEAAVCAARILECERELGRTGLLVEGARGGIVRNPIIMALSSYRQSLKTYMRELGLTPMSRQSLDVPTPTGATMTDPDLQRRIWAECAKEGVYIDFSDPDWDLCVPCEVSERLGLNAPA